MFEFQIDDNEMRVIAPAGRPNVYTTVTIITKEMFVQMYNKWILGEDNNSEEGKDDDGTV